MLNDDRLNEVEQRLRKRVDWILEDSKARWTDGGGQDWNTDAKGDPEDAPYEPSGYEVFDTLVRKLDPRFMYGGHQPMNASNPAWVMLRMMAKQAGLEFLPAGHNGGVVIFMPHFTEFKSAREYASTVAHELFHWWEMQSPQTYVGAGLKRPDAVPDKDNGGNDPAYIIEELSAELFTTLLLDHLGVEQDEESRAQYISGYMNGVPKMFRDDAWNIAKDRSFEALRRMLKHAEVA